MQCKRKTTRTTFNVTVSLDASKQNVGALSTTILGNGRSRSFFVSCDFLRQLQFWSHHLPRSATQAVPVRRFPSITQCLVCPTLASHNSVLGNAQKLAKELTPSSPIVRNQTFSPNCATGFLHLRPVLLISLVFPSLPILILFMTCAGKRGGQLSNGLSSATRTLVFCSAEIRRVLHCRFTYLTAISTRLLAM